MKKVLFTITVILLSVAPALTARAQTIVSRDFANTEISPGQPFYLAPGPCWEGVLFTAGSIKNNFFVINQDSGADITWVNNTNLTTGIGQLSGLGYSAKENTAYSFRLNNGQISFPQRRFFRLTREDGQIVNVRASYHLGNDNKIIIDRYEVECP